MARFLAAEVASWAAFPRDGGAEPVRADRAGDLALGARSKRAGRNDSARPSPGGLLNRRPRRGGGVSPDLRSRAGRQPILRARVRGPRQRGDDSRLLEWPAWCVRLDQPPSPFTNRTTLSHALLVLPRSAIGGASGHLSLGRIELAGGRCTPWKGGVHNRYAGRPEPMVWRPSGETRFMAWTQNRSRGRDPTVVIVPGSKTSTTVACSRPVRAPLPSSCSPVIVLLPFMPGPPGNRCTSTWLAVIKARSARCISAQPAQPGASGRNLVTGAPTAFDPIVGAAAARSHTVSTAPA